MIDISFVDFLHDLANPSLAFLPRALLISVISAIVCAIIGTFVVLRGMSFIGDAVAHAVFPGLAIAFALQVSVLAGGAVAGASVALLIAVFSQRRRIREDAVIGIFFAAAFALGLVVISRTEGYTASLNNFLFGSITGVSDADIGFAAIAGTLIIAAVFLLLPQLTAVALDRETARAMNLPVFFLDLVIYMAVTAAVVMSVRTIGNILVLALLITPAATARLLSDNLKMTMLIAALVGVIGAIAGVYLSWAIDLPTGATIVLVLTSIFLFAWIFSPTQGLIGRKKS
ncbi:anchored repeat-type ABC transporter permease subunit [Corynebacterium sp. ES2794-CONJ1]|uniref:anchored repeat-type ABC transporter permease subunit n=1 Tax=unclassified Corynebacterium TaxID=2624378 RepID=UPI0021693655|nr:MULTISPECIES: anchored repeat-type ABC transporter permease subunit [unclassified Corynebacterium]MCS4489969.1 anchored repeat-type ABC transporter permease subunit [Corynebacterium sp. ES2775-CONJ]MCS4491668.1 anchored repeat-type ABC transporter permease subunit [Corynebacterium sp. ES2715-CONJ3]MCU9519169.1 anchored repeat-type ABC transporter permease subunit [Corynebacterium sp. ES2794-CONJ1]